MRAFIIARIDRNGREASYRQGIPFGECGRGGGPLPDYRDFTLAVGGGMALTAGAKTGMADSLAAAMRLRAPVPMWQRSATALMLVGDMMGNSADGNTAPHGAVVQPGTEKHGIASPSGNRTEPVGAGGSVGLNIQAR